MAKYDVHRDRDGSYLLDCQADLLAHHLNTRLVVPLLPAQIAPAPASRLNPTFNVEGQALIMVTQFAATVRIQDIGEYVASLSREHDAIGNALDMLIKGF